MKAELAEIDENLVRHNLNHIDEGEQLLRRKEIYEVLHPETTAGGDRKSEKIKTTPRRFDSPKSFAEDTAEKMHIDPRTVERKVQIAKSLTPEVKNVVKANGISEKNSLKLARIKEPSKQKEVAEQLARHEIKTVDEVRRCSVNQLFCTFFSFRTSATASDALACA